MIKVANNLQTMLAKQAAPKRTTGDDIRDELVMWIPGVTGLGAGLAAHSMSEGNIPLSIGGSVLGTLAGIPLTYLLSTEDQKKQFKKNPAKSVGSVGIVF